MKTEICASKNISLIKYLMLFTGQKKSQIMSKTTEETWNIKGLMKNNMHNKTASGECF